MQQSNISNKKGVIRYRYYRYNNTYLRFVNHMMLRIMNLLFYSVFIVISKTTTASIDVVAAATTPTTEIIQKQKHLRRVLKHNDNNDSQLLQNQEHHHEIKEEHFNSSSVIKSNDNVNDKTFRMRRRQLTGQFTIVKANQPSESKLVDITLGTFNNGDIIKIYSPTAKKYSLLVEHSGPMDHIYFQYTNTLNLPVKKNSTSYEPFALSYHKGKNFQPVDILNTIGVHKIDITAYLLDLRIANIILSFTIINDPSKPSSLIIPHHMKKQSSKKPESK